MNFFRVVIPAAAWVLAAWEYGAKRNHAAAYVIVAVVLIVLIGDARRTRAVKRPS